MQWMIYGANGYTGEIIAREAAKRGLKPVLAGRSTSKLQPLASELGLTVRSFSLDDASAVAGGLKDIGLVLHCAGPFSATSAAMIEGCLTAGAHYLDITGEAPVFEHTHAKAQSDRAKNAGVVLCSGVGFDVIPTDCVAAKLKELLPDATHLSLGFDTSSGLSPGTSKTMIEGMGQGCLERQNGKLVTVALGSKQKTVDFGRGPRWAMTIPWGDVSTAYYTTGIANIDTWFPMKKPMAQGARLMALLRPLMATAPMQAMLKSLAERFVKGPDENTRARLPTWVWGEARNAKGVVKTVRIKTANGYSVTVDGALTITQFLLSQRPAGGSYTPAMLMGPDLVERLPGSGRFTVD
jgi:short subunit dehydrogenase-like uncharacterized protein